MKKQILVAALLAFAVTLFLTWHQYTYDEPATPYTTGERIQEIFINTPLFTTLFGAIIFFALQGIRYLLHLFPKIGTKG